MRLGEIKGTSSRPASQAPRGSEAAPAEQAAGSRALVALLPAAAMRQAPSGYRQMPFLAHLIAMKDLHPQTRERRRAEPGEVIAAYRAGAKLTGRI